MSENPNPHRWLLLTDNGVSTHPTAGDAAMAWSNAGTVFGQVIDLDVAEVSVRYDPPRIVLRVPDKSTDVRAEFGRRLVGRSPYEPYAGAMS